MILEDVIICLGTVLMKTKLFPIELLTLHGWKNLDVLGQKKRCLQHSAPRQKKFEKANHIDI